MSLLYYYALDVLRKFFNFQYIRNVLTYGRKKNSILHTPSQLFSQNHKSSNFYVRKDVHTHAKRDEWATVLVKNDENKGDCQIALE